MPTATGINIFQGARGFTALMSVARVRTVFDTTTFQDLPQDAQDWIKDKELSKVPSVDAVDTRPYLTRVWSVYQKGLKKRSMFFARHSTTIADHPRGPGSPFPGCAESGPEPVSDSNEIERSLMG